LGALPVKAAKRAQKTGADQNVHLDPPLAVATILPQKRTPHKQNIGASYLPARDLAQTCKQGAKAVFMV
jgi:hypothetical protein